MKALTLKRPWPSLILLHGKDIENRTWRPPASLLDGPDGGWVALHAGLGVDPAGIVQLLSHLRGDAPALAIDADAARGPTGIVGMMRVDGWIRVRAGSWDSRQVRAVPGKDWRASPWFHGPVGWLIGEVVGFRGSIPCKGAQGLWPVVGVLKEQVEHAWAEVRS